MGCVLMAEIIQSHRPCEYCGSSDALTVYADGHSYCFSCGTYTPSEDEEKTNKEDMIFRCHILDIPPRGITKRTCERYQYAIGTYKGRQCHIAPYFSSKGEMTGQKLRFINKTFLSLGKPPSTFFWTTII